MNPWLEPTAFVGCKCAQTTVMHVDIIYDDVWYLACLKHLEANTQSPRGIVFFVLLVETNSHRLVCIQVVNRKSTFGYTLDVRDVHGHFGWRRPDLCGAVSQSGSATQSVIVFIIVFTGVVFHRGCRSSKLTGTFKARRVQLGQAHHLGSWSPVLAWRWAKMDKLWRKLNT